MIATVAQLWRFPVKSMGGQTVDELRFDRRGAHADRLWAVRDLDNDITATARRIPALLGCSARFVGEPAADAGPGRVPEVVITFPGGDEICSDDVRIHDRLSELAGRRVRLSALTPDSGQHRMSVQQSKANFAASEVRKDFGLGDDEALPDTSVFTTKQMVTLMRFSTPPGSFVDLSPVHLLSVSSLAALSPDGVGYDVRRFRPNVLVDADAAAGLYPETAWVGGTVDVGSARFKVTVPTIRCVVPTRPQPGVELDRGLTRQLAERTDRFLGVYADVVTAGVVRVGDEVSAQPPGDPGTVRRAGAAAGKVAMRQLQRVLEATVLRERGRQSRSRGASS